MLSYRAMGPRISVVVIALLAVALRLAAADPYAAIIGEVLTRGTTYQNLTELSDRGGGRPATSQAWARAVDFALAKFRAYGYSDAKTETYPLKAGWQRGTARAELLGAQRRDLRVVSMPWSRGTPAGGIEAEVVDLGRGEPADFDRASRGRIGLVRLSSIEEAGLDQVLAENGQYHPIYRRAVSAGLAALLFASPHPGNQLFAIPVTRNAELTEIPVANLLRDDSFVLSRAASSGRARIRLVLENATQTPATSQNVIAELKGRDAPGDVVIVGAHYDSWDLGTGALDNGVNSMSVIEVARAIRAAGLRPRATLRFVLFGAEELGMLGSREHAKMRRAELDRIRAVLIMDEGAGRSRGFSLGGRPELESRLRRVLAPVERLVPLAFTPEAFYGTDNFFFLTEGVPNLVVNQDLREFVRHYHSNTDNLERVDPREALLNSALFAVAAYALADADTPIGPRLRKEDVEAILRKYGLEELAIE